MGQGREDLSSILAHKREPQRATPPPGGTVLLVIQQIFPGPSETRLQPKGVKERWVGKACALRAHSRSKPQPVTCGNHILGAKRQD
jgi:hypothetical protein